MRGWRTWWTINRERLLIFVRFIYTLLSCRCINKFNNSIQIYFSGSFIISHNCISTNINHRSHLIREIVLITLKLINLKYTEYVPRLHNFIFFFFTAQMFLQRKQNCNESRSNSKCYLRNRKQKGDSRRLD